MAGLLDFLNSDDAQMGLGLLAAGGPSTVPMNAAQRIGGAMQQFQAQKAAQEQAAMKKLLLQSQIDENASQNRQRDAQMQQAQLQQTALDGYANGTVPLMGLLRAGVKPDEIAKYARLADVGRPEVARTIETAGPDGRPVTMQFDKFGQPIGQGMSQWKAPIVSDTGGQISYVDPVTLQARGQMSKSQTPDSLAGNALTMRGQDMSSETARRGQDMVNQRALDGLGAAKMTEDQGKATGWLIQAENAFKNMDAVGFKDGKPTSAASPGLGDGVAALPYMGGAGNLLRSDSRQQYLQASSSLSEALLRAATGAGVNKEEAEQKIKEITPQFGDSDALKQQKREAIPLYIESLKVRAGPGAGKANTVLETDAANRPAKSMFKPDAKSAFIEIGGKSVAAKRAPDGNMYVQQPNGKWAKVVE